MAEKGNSTFGERNPRAILTEAQVVEIRRTYAARDMNMYELATLYGVRATTIFAIVHRVNWRQ
jgi:predicted DNA-binding protein YlxM (UPF0122 family)